MAEWTFGFTALRIVKLFVESTAEKYRCSEISKTLAVPQQTVWNALHSLNKAQILAPDQLITSRGQPEATGFYRITEQGFRISDSALKAVQFSSVGPSG
jgi:DNA-binding IclR family transcriptional regulator